MYWLVLNEDKALAVIEKIGRGIGWVIGTLFCWFTITGFPTKN